MFTSLSIFQVAILATSFFCRSRRNGHMLYPARVFLNAGRLPMSLGFPTIRDGLPLRMLVPAVHIPGATRLLASCLITCMSPAPSFVDRSTGLSCNTLPTHTFLAQGASRFLSGLYKNLQLFIPVYHIYISSYHFPPHAAYFLARLPFLPSLVGLAACAAASLPMRFARSKRM